MSNANDVLHAFILLDRSGSMASRWEEVLGAIDAYVRELGEAVATLATFDAVGTLKYEVIRDRVPSTDWKPLTPRDASPRGMTPLLDALARIVADAEAAGAAKTVLVIVTDGAENSSREVTRENAKAAIDRCKSRGWQVVFLGADFDAFAEAGLIGVGDDQAMVMIKGRYERALRRVAHHTRLYATKGERFLFTEEDRDEAAR